MSEEQIKLEMDFAYNSLIEYENEIIEYNDNLINSFSKTAEKHFKALINDCDVTGKIEFTDKPKGTKLNEKYGIFKDIYVDQWTVGMEGDSFEGFIYANVKDQWIKIPYSC